MNGECAPSANDNCLATLVYPGPTQLPTNDYLACTSDAVSEGPRRSPAPAIAMLAALFTYPPTIVVAFVATGSVVCEASLQACRCNTLDRRHVLLIMLCFLALLAAPSLQHCGMSSAPCCCCSHIRCFLTVAVNIAAAGLCKPLLNVMCLLARVVRGTVVHSRLFW